MTAVIGLLAPSTLLVAVWGLGWLVGRCRASARQHRAVLAAAEQALIDAAFGRIVAELTREDQ